MLLDKPKNPYFSSGPCCKDMKNWKKSLENALVCRSHRSKACLSRIQYAISLVREILCVPDSYYIAFIPASGTGAVEASLWNFLGHRGVDIYYWEAFGYEWYYDIAFQLQHFDFRTFSADYGEISSFASYDPSRDFVSVINGTTSGVCMNDFSFIHDNREGLVILDATSYAFAGEIDWKKIDVFTFAWQKVLGAESSHGAIIISPRAIEQLQNTSYHWPVPRVFRLKDKEEKVNKKIFLGHTLNTISMLCVEDCIHHLEYIQNLGGVAQSSAICKRNVDTIYSWLDKTNLPLKSLCRDFSYASPTVVCMCFHDNIDTTMQNDIQKSILDFFEHKSIAYDIKSYPRAPIGFRIWAGHLINSSDIVALLKWFEWYFYQYYSHIIHSRGG